MSDKTIYERVEELEKVVSAWLADDVETDEKSDDDSDNSSGS